ncbi:histidine-type phosphatase [Aureibacter tunicatorum]|uniref:Multiple inositol polyphosphate phosphatase 1 n=1 Tax=Aureibacter tunicatorum TaxID=866807 RepID=A0AAE3XR61_9BACT|nr:histidine-type phosphatase [Aureibacter tunicatorum]MDR6241637.1 hypothetical protein [Aureibacter tunicatorum]BDD07247.1 histidine phosphatase [Aureibacter tunicatorum]
MNKIVLYAIVAAMSLQACNKKTERVEETKEATMQVSKPEVKKEGYLGSKMPYEPRQEVVDYSPIPENFEPIFINHVARHGSRHLTSAKYDVAWGEMLQFASEKDMLTDKGKQLKNDIEVFLSIEKGNYGQISELGKKEHQDMAKRLVDQYGDLLASVSSDKKIVAKSTFKDRAVNSKKAFMGILEETFSSVNDSTVDYIVYEENKDPELRFFEPNEAFEAFEKAEYWAEGLDSLKNLDNAKHLTNQIIDPLFKSEFVSGLEQGEYAFKGQKGKVRIKDKSSAAQALYKLYQIIDGIGAKEQVDLQKYLPEEALVWNEFLGDYESFFLEGPSYDSIDLTYTMAMPLLDSFLVTSQRAIELKNQTAEFRFAHAETMVPFLALLGVKGTCESSNEYKLEDKNRWKASNVSPMGTNIQWIFFKDKSDGQIWLKMLYNEAETELPVVTNRYPFYRWENVKAHYEKVLNKEVM